MTKYKKGDFVYKENDQVNNYCYIILEGQVNLYKNKDSSDKNPGNKIDLEDHVPKPIHGKEKISEKL